MKDRVMSKLRSGQHLPAAGVLLFLFVLAAYTGAAAVSGQSGPRSDTLIIGADSGTAFRQMPQVRFLHDAHTLAVDGRCDACHDPAAGTGPRFSFKGITDTDPAARMDRFHDTCIACHGEMASQGPTGPLAAECRTCHNADTPAASAWTPLAFDRSLHYRHVSAAAIEPAVPGQDTNCSACHHGVDETTGKTVYEPGTEGACIYCHKAEPTFLTLSGPQDRIEIRPAKTAAHDACISCHLTLADKQVKTGPVTCGGCHDAAAQAAIETLTDIPRLPRNQPDFVLITGWESLGDDPDAGARLIATHMDPVAFNHQLHETANATCTACHHESLDRCILCHTADGTDKGGQVKLADAMHRATSTASCIGCHTGHTRVPNCAGCHALMPDKAFKDQPCAACHSVDVRTQPLYRLTDRSATSELAEETLTQRAWTYETVSMEQVPDIVTIGVIADQYQPSRFPHRMVVEAVFKKATDSEMARAFHGRELTLCAGCHHNSPPSMTPPRCASCHGISPDPATGKPGLMGAYHGQCISCHQEMAVASVLPTDCIKCHEKK